ncbi:alpha/beta-hydrolase [Meira miltonrushii]|uniref:Prolyl endopeptidase n=1 Tax=Meira miltonrushii TaxID=1280837 RepID=A0A316V3X1_9BASI|nr:alpha/beta-hydrolase [Meira miltonrushii]PWN31698.1 alpha/beta-hydrolase [Meira miltonrushii]
MVSYATLLSEQTISEDMKWISLAPSYDFSLFPIGFINDEYYFQTNKDAPNSKVAKIKLDWSKARQVKKFTELQDRPQVIDVIPEREDALMQTFSGPYLTAGNNILIIYVEDGSNVLHLFSAETGKVIQQIIPHEKGTVTEVLVTRSRESFTLSLQTWDTPNKIFELKWDGYQFDTTTVSVSQIKGTNPDDFVIEELHATSKDGTLVPYFITYRKGTNRNGKSPAWLHAYGAFGEVDKFYYKPNYFDFLRSYDGYFIWGTPRGGGDQTGGWHEAAQGLEKQKTFDDIIAIAEELINQNFTSAGNIILEGVSVGGTAMGAVMNQATDLFGVVLMTRAPLDIFQLETRSSIGSGVAEEFGGVNTPEGFDAVMAWSPLQNLDPDKPYPAVLLIPAQNDERAPPSSNYKFIAQLQYDHPSYSKPMLLYVAQNDRRVRADLLAGSTQLCLIEQSLGISRRKS